jgi:IrrE N-terminal-like domain
MASASSTSSQIQPCVLSLAGIRKYAALAGEQHDIYSEDGRADIRGLLLRIGGQVSAVRGGPIELDVEGPGRFTVFEEDWTDNRSRRFATTRSIGHYYLHYLHPGLEGQMSFYRGGDGDVHTQAEVFAATLLMPADQFRAAFHLWNGDSWKLGDVFDVSPQAAEVRAHVLELG